MKIRAYKAIYLSYKFSEKSISLNIFYIDTEKNAFMHQINLKVVYFYRIPICLPFICKHVSSIHILNWCKKSADTLESFTLQ